MVRACAGTRPPCRGSLGKPVVLKRPPSNRDPPRHSSHGQSWFSVPAPIDAVPWLRLLFSPLSSVPFSLSLSPSLLLSFLRSPLFAFPCNVHTTFFSYLVQNESRPEFQPPRPRELSRTPRLKWQPDYFLSSFSPILSDLSRIVARPRSESQDSKIRRRRIRL